MFLLHSNVDRLFAMWQTEQGHGWRLDPAQVYGDQSNAAGILHPVQPWDGRSSSARPSSPGWVRRR